MSSVTRLSEPPQTARRIASEEEALAVARTLAAEFAGGASRRDYERALPHEELDRLSASGLLAITVPAEYGGIDVSNAVLAEVTAILSEADSSIGQIPQNHFYILEALRHDGSEAQKRFYFGRALAGERFGNALSEVGTKTVGDYNTRITRDGAGFRINGRKFYSTGVLFAHWVAIFALDEEDRLTMSFAPRQTEGIEIVDDWDGFGQRTTGSGTTILHDVYVPADAVVPRQKGFERPGTIGSVGQIIHAGIDLGIARAALKETIGYVRDRARPWTDSGVERAADDPLTIARIGELAIRVEAAEATLERAGRKIDQAQVNLNADNAVAATL
ncbi:MAG: SfnB family sulfur acquisition oxidoreductase, partial [Shinella sp. 65-6]